MGGAENGQAGYTEKEADWPRPRGWLLLMLNACLFQKAECCLRDTTLCNRWWSMFEGKELIISATEKKLPVQWNITNPRSNHICNDQKQPNRKLNTRKNLRITHLEQGPLGPFKHTLRSLSSFVNIMESCTSVG